MLLGVNQNSIQNLHMKYIEEKKFKSIIQNAGVAQTITGGRNELPVNGKTNHKMQSDMQLLF